MTNNYQIANNILDISTSILDQCNRLENINGYTYYTIKGGALQRIQTCINFSSDATLISKITTLFMHFSQSINMLEINYHNELEKNSQNQLYVGLIYKKMLIELSGIILNFANSIRYIY